MPYADQARLKLTHKKSYCPFLTFSIRSLTNGDEKQARGKTQHHLDSERKS